MDMFLIKFIRALLFGNKDFNFKTSTNLLINQLYLDIQRVINIDETIQQGGLFQNELTKIQDLESIIKYIERGNKYFLDKCGFKNEFPLELKSSIMRNFFYNLNLVCRGNLSNGVLSNNFIKDSIPIPYKSDAETLEHILKNENNDYLVFRNAEYWGTIAKKLLHKEKTFVLTEIQTPFQYLRDIQRLYDIKCKTLGYIVEPYSIIMTDCHSFIDPIHWESVEALKLFLEHFPDSNLSQTCLSFIHLIITAIITADDDLLPKNILKHEIQLRKFIKNIQNIDNRIEKVDSSNTPLKLIDVFHRLLAFNKFDYMWDPLNIPGTTHSNNNLLINMYLKNVELEKENRLLREELKNVEKKFHINI